MDKKNSEYRNELAKDLKEMRSNDVLSEAQTNIYKRKDPTKKYFQPINRRAAKSLLETRKKINTELVEKVEKILKINVASLIKENGDNAIGLAKDCMSNIRQFAHLDGFLYLLNDSVKKDVINFTQDRVYKLKNEDIKNQFLIVRKYFDLQDFIDENYHPSTMSSLDVRPYPNGHRINKRASLDTYDAKGKVFPNRK
jgi:hypothetical protein